MDDSRHYLALLGTARRHARRADEAEDLLQEVLIAAIGAGRGDIGVAANRRWMAGAIRRRAAFDARSAARRARRDAEWQARAQPDPVKPCDHEALALVIAELPRSLRVVAALAFSGHTRGEIRYLLALSDAALRQRIVGLKKAIAERGVELPEELPGLRLELPFGQIRQGVAPLLAREKGAFATHDPDGHVFVIRRSQNG